MEPLGERPVWSMSGSDKLHTLDHLDAELARLDTYRLHVIAGLDDDGYAAEIGAHDTAQLLEYRYRLDRTRARRDLRLAKALTKYPAVATALPDTKPTDSGENSDEPAPPEILVHPAQAEAIVSALDTIPTTVAPDNVAVAEHQLIGLARHLSPAELRKAGTHIRDLLDTDGPEPEEHKAYNRETLTLITADRGVKFRGYLANENAELLRTLIHTGARPHKTIDGDPDPRPREKRQADALTTALTLAATTLDTTHPTPRRATPTGTGPTTATTPTAPTTASATASATTPPTTATPPGTAATNPPSTSTPTTGTSGTSSSGTATTASDTGPQATTDPNTSPTGTATADKPADRVPGFGAKANITVTIDLNDLKAATADAIGDTVYGDGLSAATIRRLACDANIIPLVLGSNSEPLDVGRSERLVTRAQRRALNARDKGCVVCGAPPINCDAHHLISWIDGGKTNITNLVLLCRRHHIDLHAGHWTITITAGQVHVDRPTWATPQHQPAQSQPPPTRPSTNNTGPTPSGRPGTPSQSRPSTPTPPTPSAATHQTPNKPTPRPAIPPTPEAGPSTPRPAKPPTPQAGPSTPPKTGAATSPGADTTAPDEADATALRADANAPRETDAAAHRNAGSIASQDIDSDDPRISAAASQTVGSVARRSVIGREVLQRLTSAEGEVAKVVTATSLREAACLAIWGEPATTPDNRRTGLETASAGNDRRFDPWGEPATTSDDRRAGLETATAGGDRRFDPWGEPALTSHSRPTESA